MMKIGLTGGIGSGKSLVASLFATMGIPIYVADIEAKRIMHDDPHVKADIIQLLGPKAYVDGALDRQWVASQVFTDPECLAGLNRIVHPAVHQDFHQWAGQQDAPYVIEEAAIMFKSGGFRFMDRIVSVFAPEELRIERVMARDKVSAEQVKSRMASQLRPDFVLSMSDHVIMNDGRQKIIPQVVRLHRMWCEV